MARLAVALSGGVDSSVAAMRLLDEGHDLLGVTAKLLPPGWGAARGCCDADVAAETCRRLGIEHVLVDLSADFLSRVVGFFIAGYGTGLTPNPCLPCNRLIKFGLLLEAAREMGCEALATGHYVRRGRRMGRLGLRVAADRDKDQSYMLLGLAQEQIRHSLFPLAEATKEEVVEEARRRGLPILVRESQDLCFVAADYRAFLAERLPVRPGPIVDADGNVLGTHRGLPFYTVGQRRGLGLGGRPRQYVIALDPDRNALVVGPREQLCRREFEVEGLNWVSIEPPPPGQTITCVVLVRYRGAPIRGRVLVLSPDRCRVTLEEHDQAIAPGQGAAFYDEEGWLLGGGPIARPAAPAIWSAPSAQGE